MQPIQNALAVVLAASTVLAQTPAAGTPAIK